ncbi:hypothetical protein ACHAWT_001598 [Skeletonema menzelii]|mmetsp:Transcript_19688/g.32296  ORF Transcript_19688/g.32296 Transcript_19688/m.32296 type:complete len:320 (-) Transcript_19688:207-1166(-)
MSTNDEEMASRPMQLPKVGWGDDTDNDDGAGSTSDNATAEELELPSLSNKNTSDDGVTQRAAPARNIIDDLAPIPEDYSMHGEWPDYYSDIFCYPSNTDYDDCRRKGYRYRFCRRLCEDRRYRCLGFILVVGTIALYVTSFRHRGGQSLNVVEAPLEKREQSERYEMAATTYHPQSYARDDGWTGTSYLAAMEFCLKRNKNVPCPYDAYCPLGEGAMPLGGFKDESEGTWAPFFSEGSVNEWVSLSRDNSCEKYSTRFDEKPSWGLTGRDAEGFTRHISCCLNIKGGSGSTLYNEKTSDVIARPPLLEEDLGSIKGENP